MSTKLEITDWNGRQVILTAGAEVDNCGQVCGVFADEGDARSMDADSLAVAIVGWASLSPDQQAAAERNSERLA